MSEQQEYIPKWIAWESTRRCNLSCVHCRCSSDMEAAAGDFTTEEAYKLIDDICEVSKPVLVPLPGLRRVPTSVRLRAERQVPES